MAAYTDAAKIAAYLGVTLTGAQQNQAGVLADAATAWIDRYLGRTWQDDGSVTDEQHGILGDRVYLNNRPVLTVTSVKTRAIPFVGFGWTTLSAGQYELEDAQNGVLLISGWSLSYEARALVTYTHGATSAPSDVQLAASMIAGSWLSQTLRPNTQGIDSVSVGQGDIQVKFSSSRSDVPAEARSILAGYRRFVVA